MSDERPVRFGDIGLDHPEIAGIWVDHGHGAALCVLLNGTSAFIVYLPDMNESSRVLCGDRLETAFKLKKGQIEAYPGDQVVARATALRVLGCFIAHGSAEPGLSWHQI